MSLTVDKQLSAAEDKLVSVFHSFLCFQVKMGKPAHLYFCCLRDHSVFVTDRVLRDHTQYMDCGFYYLLEVRYFFLDTL